MTPQPIGWRHVADHVAAIRRSRVHHPILAYIDPGSGSLIIQVLIASIIAIPVILRARIAQVTRAIRRDKAPVEGADDRPAAD